MANTLKPKRSATAAKVPTTSDLASGELGVNMTDQKIWINNGGSVVQIGAGKLAALADVAMATPAAGEVLEYNGSAWVDAATSGSGSVVRATSPTLATPTISTSATVPLVLGGAATTSTLTLRATSGVGTAGADIIFQTGNNGATEAMRILNGGNVGIGTATPGYRLDVQTGAGTVANFAAPSTNRALLRSTDGTYIAKFGASPPEGYILYGAESNHPVAFSTNNTERMRIDSSGNVGIGTTSPGAKLEVSGAAKANYAVATGPLAAYVSSTGGLYSHFNSTAGTLNAVSDNSGTAGTLILSTGSERMRITSAGDVGIGTASPGVKLDVVGSVKAQNTSTKYALLDASTTRPALSLYADTDTNASSILNFFNTSTSGTIASGRSQEIRFFYSDTAGTNTLSAGMSSFMSATGAANATGVGLDFRTKNTSDASAITRVRISAAGNVGIGTLTPASPLTVYAQNNQAALRVTNGPSANNVGITLESTGGNVVLNNGNGPLEVLVGGSQRMAVTTAGNVGIGTASPQAKLDVRGTVVASPIAYAATQDGAYMVAGTTSYTGALTNWGTYGFQHRFKANAGGGPRITVDGSVSGVATEFFCITGDGYVGVGTAGPETKLQVVGSGLFSGDNNYIGADGGAGTVRLGFFKKSGAGPVIAAGSTSPISFGHTDGASIQNPSTATFTERMRIDSSGNVGIGTASPAGVLDVVSSRSYFRSSSYLGTAIQFISTATNGRTWGIGSNFATGAGEFAFYDYTAAAERMRIDASGNVGIGITSYSAALAIARANNNGAAITLLTDTGGANNSYLALYNRSDAWLYATDKNGTGTRRPIRFANGDFGNATSGVSLALETNGNVGIGTTSPGAKLEASGTQAGISNPANGVINVTDAATAALGVGGQIVFRGNYTGTTSTQYAAITAYKESATVDGTQYGASLIFNTRTQGGSNSEKMRIDSSGNVLVTGAGGLGYGTGSGGAVTQTSSRTTGVTLDKTNGAITLVSAAGTTTWQSFTVTNNKVAATDTIIVNQKSGTDLYQIFVTNVAAGSFKITFATTGGTTTEQPVFNFAVLKAVTA